MKFHHLAMLTIGVVAITAIVLSTAWARDTSRAERALATPIESVEPMLSTPISLKKTYRVDCADDTATNVLVPMDGGSASNPIPASSIYVAVCDLDVDGGPSTCTTARNVRVGGSDVHEDVGFELGASGRDGYGVSLDARGAWCAGVAGAQQVDVVVGMQ